MESYKKIGTFSQKLKEVFEKLELVNKDLNTAKDIVDWLATHNKNYTKEQYYKILELQELIIRLQ